MKNQFQVQNLGDFNSPYEIAYYNKEGYELKRRWYRQKQKSAFYKIPENCSYAIIDPDKMMPDIFRSNNSSKRNKKLKNKSTRLS